MNKSTYTLQLDENTISNVIDYYAGNDIALSNPYTTNHYKFNNVDISVFKSCKVLFSGKNAFDEYVKFSHLVNWEFTYTHAGSDEVGTGDFFGPVIVVAVLFNENDLDFVNSLNIKDSKKLNDDYIFELGPNLINHFKHSILILNNNKYNEMNEKGFNMNKLKAYLHNKAYLNLITKVGPINEFVLDQFEEKQAYFNHLSDYKEIVTNVTFRTKGEDKSPAVAVASLIARYVFLVEMKKISDLVGFEIKKGAGSEVIKQKRYIENRKGKDFLRNIAKLNFKTIEQ